MQAREDLSYGVISFYSAQVELIKKKLGDLAEKVRVGSVDAFQGMEFDVIFLSVVRSSDKMIKNLDLNLLESSFEEGSEEKLNQDKYIDSIGTRMYGFLTSENRLCVALSRQKKLLIVVGNSDIFVKDDFGRIAQKCVPAMKNLYKLCEKDGVLIDG